MEQFIHAADLARAVIAAMDGSARGAFNVAGPTALPWSLAIELAGARPVVVPSKLVALYVRTMTGFPEYLVNFLKYPCVITDRAFRRAFGWEPQVGIRETLASVRA
jgi:UDP-glucose 4-epimerase